MNFGQGPMNPERIPFNGDGKYVNGDGKYVVYLRFGLSDTKI